ncbi:hypothetical protein WJX73_004755 [Symbiochloris irregularis]|uniref:EamA domain-containing protein n=1 Tax=Symbiochloris irregularis TaxID=706552 RepID=A0AAW1PA99_9CHLO
MPSVEEQVLTAEEERDTTARLDAGAAEAVAEQEFSGTTRRPENSERSPLYTRTDRQDDSPLTSSSGNLCAVYTRSAANLRGFVWNSGICCIAISSLISALNGLAVKLVVDHVPALELQVVRAIVCWLMTVSAKPPKSSFLALYGRRENWIPLSVRGWAGGAAMAAYYFGLQYLPLGDAMTLLFLSPIVACILAWVLLGEAMGLQRMAGVACALCGVFFVAQPPFLTGSHMAWGLHHIIGVVASAAGAILLGVASVSIRYLSAGESALAIAMWYHSCSIALGTVPMMVGWPDQPVLPTPFDALVMLFIGVTSFGGQVLYGRSFQLEPPSKLAAVNYLQVLYGTVFGVILLGDSLTWPGMLGSALIAAGVILATFKAATALKMRDSNQHLPDKTDPPDSPSSSDRDSTEALRPWRDDSAMDEPSQSGTGGHLEWQRQKMVDAGANLGDEVVLELQAVKQ